MVEKYMSMRGLGKEGQWQRKIHFSKKEVKDLVKAWIILSIAFAIMLSGFNDAVNFIKMFIISSLTIGIGFLFHETAHKIVAQRYGCWAEFRAFNNMLVLSLFMSLFGFLFAAPGAVMIAGFVNKEKNGRISLAGPLTNIALAIIFLAISFISGETLSALANYGYTINTWLALFNMIPFGMFDGAKVLEWDKKVYGFFVVLVLLLFALPYAI